MPSLLQSIHTAFSFQNTKGVKMKVAYLRGSQRCHSDLQPVTGDTRPRLTQSDHHRLHVFGWSPVLDQEVDHTLGLDHEVATEKEDPEHHRERKNAQHRDLHHARNEHLALVLCENQRPAAVVCGHLAPVPRAAIN